MYIGPIMRNTLASLRGLWRPLPMLRQCWATA